MNFRFFVSKFVGCRLTHLAVAGVCLLLLLRPDALAETADGRALAFVRTQVEYAKAILESASCVAGLQSKSCQDRLEKLVERSLNYQKMTERATRGLPLEESTEDFSARFRAMLVRHWRSRLKGEPTCEFSVLTVSEGVARVEVKRGKTTWTVDFVLVDDDGRFWIVDFMIDDRGLARTYRTQFARVLKDRGWRGLLERMSRYAD